MSEFCRTYCQVEQCTSETPSRSAPFGWEGLVLSLILHDEENFSCLPHAVDRKTEDAFTRIKKPRAATNYIYAEVKLEKIIKNLETSVCMALFARNLLSEIDFNVVIYRRSCWTWQLHDVRVGCHRLVRHFLEENCRQSFALRMHWDFVLTILFRISPFLC